MKTKVSFHTFGCKVNFAETSTLARAFAEAGFERVGGAGTEYNGDGEVGAHNEAGVDSDGPARSGVIPAADVYVVNSCSVTAAADKKCRNLVSRIHRHSPHAVVAVTGCYAQLAPERVASIPGVDLVFGNGHKGDIVAGVIAAFDARRDALGPGRDALDARWEQTAITSCPHSAIGGFFEAWSAGDRTRSFLKVQDGCDYKCSYCTIHYARGASRSISIAEAVAQAGRIAALGVKEIVLTGINTGDFGRPAGESFLDLLRALDADPSVASIERYRISSIEPNLLTDEIIDFCAASTRFQHHFHIPLQSGSDRILGLMRRRYTTADFARRVERVRRAMPDAFIGVDVIVGFPGETDEDFAATRALLELVRPAGLHVFPYSERPGTPAATMPGKVPPPVAAARAAALGTLGEQLHAEFTARFAGTPTKVLFEAGAGSVSGGAPRTMSGFTGNYIRITVPFDPAKVNTVSEVVLGA